MNKWELTPKERSKIRQRMVRIAPQFSADREISMIELAGKEAQKKLVKYLKKEFKDDVFLGMSAKNAEICRELCKALGIEPEGIC